MEFVGDFEAKYKAESDPWEQSGAVGDRSPYYQFSRQKLYARLHNRIPKGARGCEIGCGLGFTTKILANRFDMTGVDVAPTAIKRATELNPGLDYRLADVTSENFIDGPLTAWRLKKAFDFVVLGQCWWYMLHALDQVIVNASVMLKDDGYLVVSQAFLKEQNYGREIADGFEGACRIFMDKPGWRLLEASYDDTGKHPYHDGLIIVRCVVGA